MQVYKPTQMGRMSPLEVLAVVAFILLTALGGLIAIVKWAAPFLLYVFVGAVVGFWLWPVPASAAVGTVVGAIVWFIAEKFEKAMNELLQPPV